MGGEEVEMLGYRAGKWQRTAEQAGRLAGHKKVNNSARAIGRKEQGEKIREDKSCVCMDGF